MKTNNNGEHSNPLRKAVAARLERERISRSLTRLQFVDLIRSGTPGRRFSYGTYIRTRRCLNNMTLRTLEHMAKTLDISIADFLYGDRAPPEWVRRLDKMSIKNCFSKQMFIEQQNRGLTQLQFANQLGVAEVTYTKLLHKRANFTLDTIAVIAQGCGKSPLEFLFGEKTDGIDG